MHARRPTSNCSYIEIAHDAGYSNYNAMQVKLEKRYSGWLYPIFAGNCTAI